MSENEQVRHITIDVRLEGDEERPDAAAVDIEISNPEHAEWYYQSACTALLKTLIKYSTSPEQLIDNIVDDALSHTQFMKGDESE